MAGDQGANNPAVMLLGIAVMTGAALLEIGPAILGIPLQSQVPCVSLAGQSMAAHPAGNIQVVLY